MNERTILITGADFEALSRLLLEQRAVVGSRRHSAELQKEIERAKILEASAIPEDVITMHSTFELVDLDTGDVETYTLVFPEETNTTPGGLSVLAPIGTASLGYRVGDEFEWKVPAGTRRLRVAKVLYQPEATGDWGRRSEAPAIARRAMDQQEGRSS